MTCSNIKSISVVSLVMALAPAVAFAQNLFNESDPHAPVLMITGDRAVLEAHEERRDISCDVTPVKPALGFDLRFHSGYELSIPLKDLVGDGNVLTMIFRVFPADRPQEARYFYQRITVPSIPTGTGGSAYLQGSFDVGEGDYKVDWLMRDRAERFCSSSWDIAAHLPEPDLRAGMRIQPWSIEAADAGQFKDEPPVNRMSADAAADPPLKVKILINFAPQRPNSAVLQPVDTSALVTILRTIAREPRIGTFSIVAFNLQEERILYRQENAGQIDFPALGAALETLKLGTINLKRLEQKHSETEFLTNLIQTELGGEDRPDALIFAGPKAILDENIPTDSLKEIGRVDYPVFYMNYNLTPQEVPWRDSIGRAVKYFRGEEFTISRPRDLWSAVTDIVSRIVRARNVRRSFAAPSE